MTVDKSRVTDTHITLVNRRVTNIRRTMRGQSENVLITEEWKRFDDRVTYALASQAGNGPLRLVAVPGLLSIKKIKDPDMHWAFDQNVALEEELRERFGPSQVRISHE